MAGSAVGSVIDSLASRSEITGGDGSGTPQGVYSARCMTLRVPFNATAKHTLQVSQQFIACAIYY